ncbi:MAG: NAD(P)-dependent oxidoreductase [Methanobacteriota archaeon]|nr:MAG: NAD(P)-dependent oxidoreductase [Euryarchaeota archaeon]
MKIAFLGTGIMGFPMAENLLKNGFSVAVWNRTIEKAKPLVSKGATLLKDLNGKIDEFDVVITMLAHPAAVKSVMLDNNVLTSMRSGALWMDCSTVDPYFSKEMATLAHENEVRFIDAPVAGSKVPAIKGELLFLVGGSETDLEEVTPLINAMGRGYVHAGPIGSGAALKMVFNMLLGIQIAAFSEALALAKGLGLKQDLIFDVILNSPIVAPYLKLKEEKIRKKDFSPEFPLKWMQKDLGLVSRSAQESNTALPLAHVVKEIYQMAKREFGEMDFSAITEFYDSK